MDITADAIRVVLGDKKLEITEDTYLIDELGFNSLGCHGNDRRAGRKLWMHDR